MTSTTWYNTNHFRELIERSYNGIVTVEILSIAEIKAYEVEFADGEPIRFTDAWEVKSRNTTTETHNVFEDTTIVIMPEPRMVVAKNARRNA